MEPLKDKLRLSTILDTSNKSVWSNVVWYVKKYVYSLSAFNKLTIEIKHKS